MSMRVDARVMASTAPRNAREPGSPEWCYQTMNLMKHSYESIQTDHKRFENYLDELREHRAWEKVPIGDPYGSEDQMLAVELGKRAEDVSQQLKAIRQAALAAQNRVVDEEDRAGQRPVGTNQHSEGVYIEENIIHTQRPSGTSSEAAIRRLRKERPDIHSRVLAGELTPHGGMIEAGFRQKPASQKLSAFERIRRLIERLDDDLTHEERLQLKELL